MRDNKAREPNEEGCNHIRCAKDALYLDWEMPLKNDDEIFISA